MTLNEYQKQAMTTCLPSSKNFSYMMLNLVGEVGEFASKVAKAIRKDIYVINENVLELSGTPISPELQEKIKDMPEEERKQWADEYVTKAMQEHEHRMAELQKEAGDILWQLSGLCAGMGWNLEDIAQQNLDKLASRKQRNQIDGNGDNR